MKKKFLYIVSILTILALVACGPAPTPTLSSADIGNTAIADAWIAITLTQAAMPTLTPTPIPPTPTLAPTSTPVPTLAPIQTLASGNNPSAAATVDPCNEVPPAEPKGTLVKVKLVNKSGGDVSLAFGMMQENSFGECVTYSFTLGTFDEPVVTVLAGCYWGYAWITGKAPSIAKTGSNVLCLTDPSKTPAVWIESERIYFH